MNRKSALAAIVRKEDADRAIAGLKAEGCYDDARRILEESTKSLAIPIREEPAETPVNAVRIQPEPEWRIRDLDDILRVRGFSASERELVPTSFAMLGSVIVGRFGRCPRPGDVGEALLDLYRSVETVLSIEAIEGEHREPRVRVIAGSGETETVHVEHGTVYAMDLAEIMFSPGNQAERVRMGEMVEPDEEVFDMFAGIGYFTLPMARDGANVIATERNPRAYRFLRENLTLNDVNSRVDAYRVDCRSLRPRADRVVMGHYDASSYLDAAMAAIRPGGIVHLHAVAAAENRWIAAETALERAAGDRSVRICDRRTVKTHSPRMVHVVIDAQVGAS